MPIFQLKKELLDQIAALRSLNSGFPTFQLNNSFPSLNNSANAIDFLLDLLKQLVGYEELKEQLIRYLTYQVQPIEGTLKKALKLLLRKYFSCSTDALIPDDYLEGLGSGFNITLSQIDFFEILKVDPSSEIGSLIYGANSNDLNTFLYNVIQGITSNWNNLIVVEYSLQGIVDGIVKSNILNIKIDASWIGKTVNDFINEFIDKVIILTLPTFINKLFDLIFGSLSAALGKSKSAFENEAQLEILINKIVNLPDITIDDSYFEFSKEEVADFNRRVNERSNGRKILTDCGNVNSSISLDDITNTYNLLGETSTLVELQTILSQQFNILSADATSQLPFADQNYGKLSFFEELFKGIIQVLANLVFSPKVMFLFTIYFKVVTNTIGFFNFEEFLINNRKFVIEIIKDTILPLVVNFLFKLVLDRVRKLVLEEQVARRLEMINNQQRQILSLLGISSEIQNILNSI